MAVIENLNFDDIRCYQAEDFEKVHSRFISDPALWEVASKLPFEGKDYLANACHSASSLREFHRGFVIPLLSALADNSVDKLEYHGFEDMDPHKGYLFISNHRDIVMDTTLLNVLLARQSLPPSQTAIGDNLLAYPWIQDLVRLSKCFIVKRGLSGREQMEASIQLSAYIRQSIVIDHDPVWLAQREGRAKDSDDRTQPSVLKMLNLSGDSNVIQNLSSLNLVPLSITYEYDPCDYLKAKEMQLKRDIEGFHKSQEDDLLNMRTGIMGFKGRVFYSADFHAAEELRQLDAAMPRKEIFEQVASLLDRKIHLGYHLYPNQYIAADLLEGGHQSEEDYTMDERQRFTDYIERQLNKIDLPESVKDRSFLRKKLLEMYANPVKNKRLASAQ